MDKITYELIRSSLYSISREMKVAMMRTAASPIIHSGGDASAAIFDADMQLVAQGNDIPTMLGSAVISTRVSVDAIGRDRLRPGDVILSNDAYLGGGNHQPDVQFTRPVFLDGEIIAFTMTRGHWSDIGGQSPGSYNPDTWDIFGEGLRIPPVLLYRDDEPVTDVFNMVIHNMRDSASRVLDIKAQYAGTYIGEQRILALVGKYGTDNLHTAMAQSLDHSEQLMRAQIQQIPDGVYHANDFLEPVGGEGELLPIKVKITVDGERIVVDYTGSAPQVRGGINCPYSVTCNSTWFTIKAITDKDIPINQGCYRSIEIIAPESSVLNCSFPASVITGNTETSPRVIDLLLKALAPALPNRVIAQSHCAASAASFAGIDPDQQRVQALQREYVSMMDVHAGGMGARPDKDGVNAVRVYVGNTGCQSIEQIEYLQPLTVQEWSIVPDSGGAGRWRGGCTTQRKYRVEFAEATFTVVGERERVEPQGMFGGLAGQRFHCTIDSADGRSETMPAKGHQAVLSRHDQVTIQPAGSGGYGNPLQRPTDKVLEDVRNGYVSLEAAREQYGVEFSGSGAALVVDTNASEKRMNRKSV
jgi:N-methylhydantoinase B